MRVLILGAGGLLGRHLASAFADRETTALRRAEADITDTACMDALFGEPWNVVINAAAICDFDECERDPAATGRVNHDAPLYLAQRCHRSGALFVQFGSDYVFAGDEDRVLSEFDETQPLSVYGGQKADLERSLPAACPRSLLLRIAWLYGHGGRTFMSMMPRLLAREETLRVASGKRGRCLYAPDAAAWVRRLVDAGQTGLFNLANTGDTSWEEFARATRDEMEALGLRPRCRDIVEVPFASLGPNWAKRPRFSCLDTTQLERLAPPGPRPWREALRDFVAGEKSFAAALPL